MEALIGPSKITVRVQVNRRDAPHDLCRPWSALAQPRQTFAGTELHLTVAQKAAALGFSLITNHSFVDGNKRVGHAAMETFLVLNGYEINAEVDEQERVVLQVASGEIGRAELHNWLAGHLSALASTDIHQT